jgi:hypothetical protein
MLTDSTLPPVRQLRSAWLGDPEPIDYQSHKSGAISAFAIDRESGRLKLLNQVSSRGAGPCYLSLDQTDAHRPGTRSGNSSLHKIREDQLTL